MSKTITINSYRVTYGKFNSNKIKTAVTEGPFVAVVDTIVGYWEETTNDLGIYTVRMSCGNNFKTDLKGRDKVAKALGAK